MISFSSSQPSRLNGLRPFSVDQWQAGALLGPDPIGDITFELRTCLLAPARCGCTGNIPSIAVRASVTVLPSTLVLKQRVACVHVVLRCVSLHNEKTRTAVTPSQ